MSSSPSPAGFVPGRPYRMVAFDIGGVLARITHDWREAAQAAGVETSWPAGLALPIHQCPSLEGYQAGTLSLEAYLADLAQWAGCSPSDAGKIHDAILREEYPGVLQLVEELQADGVLTGCLSNTNAAHWVELTGERFPAIARVERKMASHLVGLSKPDPAIYRLFADVNGIAPAEIVFFDDHLPNVEAAQAAGFHAFRIDPSGDTAAQMRAFLDSLERGPALPRS